MRGKMYQQVSWWSGGYPCYQVPIKILDKLVRTNHIPSSVYFLSLDRNLGVNFYQGIQFDTFCRNNVRCYVICTILVLKKVPDFYFVTNCFSFFFHKSRDCCAHDSPSINNC